MENLGGDCRAEWVANKSLKFAETTEKVDLPRLSICGGLGSAGDLRTSVIRDT